mmetsp:Transcript_17942/g.37769  ORF Transcript_17942/g.37769 Transcript_17942/m.37769 type:complete len:202 (-) Transcript_17942:1089-1694(-)
MVPSRKARWNHYLPRHAGNRRVAVQGVAAGLVRFQGMDRHGHTRQRCGQVGVGGVAIAVGVGIEHHVHRGLGHVFHGHAVERNEFERRVLLAPRLVRIAGHADHRIARPRMLGKLWIRRGKSIRNRAGQASPGGILHQKGDATHSHHAGGRCGNGHGLRRARSPVRKILHPGDLRRFHAGDHVLHVHRSRAHYALGGRRVR